jgi:hypothetical protein
MLAVVLVVYSPKLVQHLLRKRTTTALVSMKQEVLVMNSLFLLESKRNLNQTLNLNK